MEPVPTDVAAMDPSPTMSMSATEAVATTSMSATHAAVATPAHGRYRISLFLDT
jgi:hypothetical protein